MITPLIPTLALSLLSLFCSAFVVLRIVIPILPPHPFSRRVSPSEFGLPNFRPLSAADKSHVWLALCDMAALTVFVWEAIAEKVGGPSDFDIASDPLASARLWFAMTLHPTCLLIVSANTLLHVRMALPVSFGRKHWMLWSPLVILVITSTSIAAVLAGSGVTTLFVGYVAYSSTIAGLSTTAFLSLVATLLFIKRNLSVTVEDNSWPPVKNGEQEKAPRRSFATEDVDRIREGASWLTSHPSDYHESLSAFSFSSHHSHVQHPALASQPSIPAKSSYWFNPGTPVNGVARQESIPPVPPLPPSYKTNASPTSPDFGIDADPFYRAESPHAARARIGSQSSWLSSSSGTRETLSAWSYPTTHHTHHDSHMMAAVASTQDLNQELLHARPDTPALSGAQVLGGYGYSPSNADQEKGLSSFSDVVPTDVNISIGRIVGWLAIILVPWALSLPFFLAASPTHPMTSQAFPLLLAISVTSSSPILALNILLRSPIPIPTTLFPTRRRKQPPSIIGRSPSPLSTLRTPATSSTDLKRSISATVVEGRRSTDVWIDKGEAVAGRGRVGRAMGMLVPTPKLAVLPPDGSQYQNSSPITPPLPIQDPARAGNLLPTPQSSCSAEVGRKYGRSRKESRHSSHLSSDMSHMKIMVAQRHCSAVATTILVPPLPGKAPSTTGVATGVASTPKGRVNHHLRSRSASSVERPRFPMTPPPSSPLPPTPPSKVRPGATGTIIENDMSEFSFGPVCNDDLKEIDALSAGLLPLLVPGLKLGPDMRVKDADWSSSPGTWSKSAAAKNAARMSKHKLSSKEDEELGFASGADFSSPQFHSTPTSKNGARSRKSSGHKKGNFSLPSLSLGKDGFHSLSFWRNDTNDILELRAHEALFSQRKANAPHTFKTTGNRPHTVIGELDVTPEASPEPVHHQNTQEPRVAKDQYLNPAGTLAPSDNRSSVQSNPRSSILTLIAALEQPYGPVSSAASDATLFDFDGDDGPLAESTPPQHKRKSAASSQMSKSAKASRRSGIIYIKSNGDDAYSPSNADPNASILAPQDEAPASSERSPYWSTRTVRPLVLKSGKKSSISTKTTTNSTTLSSLGSPFPSSDSHADSHVKGLRPLSLLQDRNKSSADQTAPISADNTTGAKGDTRSSVLGKSKRQSHSKKRRVTEEVESRASKGKKDENSDVSGSLARDGSSSKKGHRKLRSLKLMRSDTTKEREKLREREILPDVVVRPPSTFIQPEWAKGW